MAMSTAERQAKYRAGRATAGQLGDKRLNTWVSADTSYALQRLAKHHGVSQREMLERLVRTADQDVLKSLSPFSPEWQAYTAAK